MAPMGLGLSQAGTGLDAPLGATAAPSGQSFLSVTDTNGFEQPLTITDQNGVEQPLTIYTG